MPTIKDALDIIGKLTVAEQESLKTMLLSPAFVKSLNIEDFVAKERFANGRVCPLCGCIHVVRNGHRKDGTQRYVCKDCGKSFVIATNSIVSVSYTHLDVYKRQGQGGEQAFLHQLIICGAGSAAVCCSGQADQGPGQRILKRSVSGSFSADTGLAGTAAAPSGLFALKAKHLRIHLGFSLYPVSYTHLFYYPV